jgi:hypothetical protein
MRYAEESDDDEICEQCDIGYCYRCVGFRGEKYCACSCQHGPREDEGEIFRGNEASGYLAESQARIQRELK